MQGYILGWDTLTELLERGFSEVKREHKAISIKGSCCICTQPPVTFSTINQTLCRLLFETYEVASVCIVPVPCLTHLSYASKHLQSPAALSNCGVVVDVGFSFTHISPIIDGKVVGPAVVRCTIAGKFLTNYLKELVSYRAWNMMDDYYLINDVKVRTSLA
eukprot:scaffold1987_cov377-Prasinococcus_capsulatus_cf.AAC.6